MLFSNLYAKMEEDKAKESSVDGRRFNVRSKIRMDREAEVIKRSIAKNKKKKNSRKKSRQGMFSEEEIRAGEEAKKQFREEMRRKRELKESKESKELEELEEPKP